MIYDSPLVTDGVLTVEDVNKAIVQFHRRELTNIPWEDQKQGWPKIVIILGRWETEQFDYISCGGGTSLRDVLKEVGCRVESADEEHHFEVALDT